jgi:hypothetical protein
LLLLSLIKVSLTAKQIADEYKKGGEEAFESNFVAFVKKDVLIADEGPVELVVKSTFVEDNGEAAPVSYDSIKSKLVPSARFAVDMLRHVRTTEFRSIKRSKMA